MAKNLTTQIYLKVFLSYILLTVFLIKPLYNLGYIVYYELNVEYIVAKYCINKEKPQLHCDGKCHLAKQLATDTQNKEGNKKPMSLLSRIFYPVYFQEYINSFKPYLDEVKGYNNWGYCKIYTSFFKETQAPPPWVNV